MLREKGTQLRGVRDITGGWQVGDLMVLLQGRSKPEQVCGEAAIACCPAGGCCQAA